MESFLVEVTFDLDLDELIWVFQDEEDVNTFWDKGITRSPTSLSLLPPVKITHYLRKFTFVNLSY